MRRKSFCGVSPAQRTERHQADAELTQQRNDARLKMANLTLLHEFETICERIAEENPVVSVGVTPDLDAARPRSPYSAGYGYQRCITHPPDRPLVVASLLRRGGRWALYAVVTT